jgi:hypothetical protein
MSIEKDRLRASQLMALAVSSHSTEEGRSAALAAVKLITEHKMLDAPSPIGLADPPKIDASAQREIDRLRKQIEQLKRERSMPPATIGHALDVIDHLKIIESLRREVARLQAMPRAASAILIHVVQPGESPMSITRAHTGNMNRLPELIAANPQKPSFIIGRWRTFGSLVVGERLRLPDAWV